MTNPQVLTQNPLLIIRWCFRQFWALQSGSAPTFFIICIYIMKVLPYLLFLLLFITYFLVTSWGTLHVDWHHLNNKLFLFCSLKEYFPNNYTKGWSYLNDYRSIFRKSIGSAILVRILAGIYRCWRTIFQNNRTTDLLQLSLIPLYAYVFSFIYNACRSFINTCRGVFLGFWPLLSNCLFITKQWKCFHPGHPIMITHHGNKKNFVMVLPISTIIYADAACYIFVQLYNMPGTHHVDGWEKRKREIGRNTLTNRKYITQGELITDLPIFTICFISHRKNYLKLHSFDYP